METLLHEPIRNVIARYPSIGSLLAEQGIDCTSCSVGTCLLKDVLKVHGFPAQQEQQLLADIRNLMHHTMQNSVKTAIPLGGETDPANAPIPLRGEMVNPFQFPSEREAWENKEISSLCDPILDLVVEHARIQNLMSLAPRFISRKNFWGEDRTWVEGIIRFARLYADHFHHGKEEDILFRMADSSHAIIQIMLKEHQLAREHLNLADEGLITGDAEKLEQGLARYIDLLRTHIRREDDILYPWLDRTLTEDQKSELTERFDRLDTREGSALEADLDLFAESAEKHLLHVKSDTYPFTSSREKTMERLVSHPNAAISHMILPAGESVEGHKAGTNVYFIITHGMITVRHSQTQEEKYVQGHVIHLPPDTWMELRNEGPGQLEMFIVRAPNPEA